MKPEFKNKLNECTKTEDGRTVFLSRSVAVCCPVLAITDENVVYVMVSMRGSGTPNYQGYWNLVCGYLDFNETTREAVKRELWEETGFNVDDIPKDRIEYGIDKNPWVIGDDPKGETQNVTLRYGFVFGVDTVDDLPELTNEYSEPNEVSLSAWIKLSEVMENIIDNDGDEIIEEFNIWAFNHYDVIRDFVDLVL